MISNATRIYQKTTLLERPGGGRRRAFRPVGPNAPRYKRLPRGLLMDPNLPRTPVLKTISSNASQKDDKVMLIRQLTL
jgi:hypothetical protein